jgi:hypothetical protein
MASKVRVFALAPLPVVKRASATPEPFRPKTL